MFDYDWDDEDERTSIALGFKFVLRVQDLPDGQEGVSAFAMRYTSSREEIVVDEVEFFDTFNSVSAAKLFLQGMDLKAYGEDLIILGEMDNQFPDDEPIDDDTQFLANYVSGSPSLFEPLHAVMTFDGQTHVAASAGGDVAVCGRDGRYVRYLRRSFDVTDPSFCPQCASMLHHL